MRVIDGSNAGYMIHVSDIHTVMKFVICFHG